MGAKLQGKMDKPAKQIKFNDFCLISHFLNTDTINLHTHLNFFMYNNNVLLSIPSVTSVSLHEKLKMKKK